MAEFVANLDRINALAERSPGFVWRLKDDEGHEAAKDQGTSAGNAIALRPFGENILVNMSVWENITALSDYAFKSAHVDIMRRRREWFDRMDQAYAVLWWVPAGHHPSLAEAAARLERLRQCGATPRAFTFKESFPEPGELHAIEVGGKGGGTAAS